MEKTPESNLTLAHQHWIYPAKLILAMPTLPGEERFNTSLHPQERNYQEKNVLDAHLHP